MAPSKAPLKPTEPGKISQLYLFVYNSIQITGWIFILYRVISYALLGLQVESLWSAVSAPLTFFQTIAILEIINVGFGLVRASLVTTTLQVASRLWVLWVVLIAAPSTRETVGLPLLLVAWSITEIIRYSFYALNLFGSVPYFISWCRYTFFYVLYPMGVSGELIAMYNSVAYHEKDTSYSFTLPNFLNYELYLPYVLYVVMLVYIPGFPFLYLHMVKQRRKFFGEPATVLKKTK